MKRAGLKNQIGIFSLKWENILNLDVNGSQLNTNFPMLRSSENVQYMCIQENHFYLQVLRRHTNCFMEWLSPIFSD